MKGLPKVLFVDGQDEVLEDITVGFGRFDPNSDSIGDGDLRERGPVHGRGVISNGGADFLAQVISGDPHVSTMLLTGHANYANP